MRKLLLGFLNSFNENQEFYYFLFILKKLPEVLISLPFPFALLFVY